MKKQPNQRENPDPISSYDPPSFKSKKQTIQNSPPEQGSNTPYSNGSIERRVKE